MRKMKDSGIEWIGEIAEDCILVPIKYILKDKDSIKVGPFGSQLSGSDFVDEETDYWVYNQRTVIDQNYESGNAFISEEKYNSMTAFQVSENDILLTTRGTIGKISRVPLNHAKGILHPCIIRFRINEEKYNYRLLELIFNESEFITKQITYKSNATTIEVIYSDTLKNIYLPNYKMDKQVKIANFLDEKCAEIDLLVNDIQQQIEILEQYKRSVITEAVTKGIDPNVEMKDSGFDWIGNIPKEWEIIKLKYLTKIRAESDLFYPEIDFYIGLENVKGYSNDLVETKTEYEISMQSLCKKDDVMFNKLRPYLAKVLISPFDGFCTGEFLLFKEFAGDKRFLKYFLLSCGFIDIVNASTYGAKMPRANTTFILNQYIAAPCISKQSEIADYLDIKCAEIDKLIKTKKKQLKVIDNYKKTIIYEYITGKKEIKYKQ